MKAKTLLLVAAAALLGLVGVASQARAATPKPTVAAQLNAYLKAMQRPATAMESAYSKADNAVFYFNEYQKYGDVCSCWPDMVEMLQKGRDIAVSTLPALAKVKAPATMKGPHALFVAATRTFIKNEQAAKNAAAPGPPDDGIPNEDIWIAAAKGQTFLQQAEANWRQELIVQLRRAKITVPLWVKQVGV